MGARILDVADAVTRALQRRSDPESDVTVSRAYAPDWLDPDYWVGNPDLATSFTGRRAFVFPATQRQDGPATRAEDSNDYGIAVVVLERYDGSEAEVPQAWLDARVQWVESEVYDVLGDAREAADPVLADGFPLGQEWTQVYSPELLRQLKLFRSEVVVTYRKVEDTRP